MNRDDYNFTYGGRKSAIDKLRLAIERCEICTQTKAFNHSDVVYWEKLKEYPIEDTIDAIERLSEHVQKIPTVAEIHKEIQRLDELGWLLSKQEPKLESVE